MRPGGSHKSSVERTLIAVRARIRTALDALDGETIEPAKARTELDQAEKALRSVELRLSAARSRPASLLEQYADTPSVGADMQNWLLTFTDVDMEAADSNFEMHARTLPRSQDAGRRSSIQEQFEEISRAMAKPDVAEILLRAAAFDFDALALARTPEVNHRLNSIFGAYVVQHRGSMIKAMKEKGWISDHVAFSEAFQAFLGRLDDLYVAEAVYHGAAHAVDVTATTEWLMRTPYIRERTTTLDHFMALAASALHDVGHPGKNNLFQSKTMSPLAIRYNDRSVLENMHVALAFETMRTDQECNWFALLLRDNSQGNDVDHHSANLQQYVRKGLISMVLATDMAKHSKHCEDLNALVQEVKEEPEHTEPGSPKGDALQLSPAEKQKALERKLFLLETVLHAADISNPCKPRQIMLGWTRRVISEFWMQGDEERRLGLEVSPLCDRESGMASVPKGQLGFINFVVQPFFAPLAELVAEAREATEELLKNAEFWKGKDAEGATFDQIFADGVS